MAERMISAAKLVIVLAKKFRTKAIHYDDLMETIADIPAALHLYEISCSCKRFVAGIATAPIL